MRRLGTLLGAFAVAIGLLPAQAQALASPLPKISVIVLENTKRSAIVGKSAAPFMNALIAQGKEFTDYHGFKGSPHDYKAMVAGQQSVTKPVSNNLFHQFDTQGVSWVNLEESMGGNCGVNPSPNVVPGSSDPLYDHGHDPAYAYRANSSCKANDRPLTSDAQLRSLPSFSYIVPNNCGNAHTFPSGGNCPAYFGTNHGSSRVNLADSWVAHVVGVITAADPSVTVFVTFDESTTGTKQLLYAAEIGPGVAAGTKDGQRYDHYSFCAGIWREYGLAGTAPNNAASATPLPL
jgi:Phosphoesterase family